MIWGQKMFSITKDQVELPDLFNFILKRLKTRQKIQKDNQIFWLTVITEPFQTVILQPWFTLALLNHLYLYAYLQKKQYIKIGW